MKTESQYVKNLVSGLNEGHLHTNFHLTNSAINEKLMNALEHDALLGKQQAISEWMAKLVEVDSDPKRMVKESEDEVWKGWGMLIL